MLDLATPSAGFTLDLLEASPFYEVVMIAENTFDVFYTLLSVDQL
jgi:hypothetical protein